MIFLTSLTPIRPDGRPSGGIPEQMAAEDGSSGAAYEQSTREARTFLTFIADAQIKYFAENNFWAGYPDGNGVFKKLGWNSEWSTRYAYYCGNDYILPKTSEYPYRWPDPKKNWPYGTFPDITLNDFVCMAIGNNDPDDFPDVWMIDKFRTPVHLLDDASNKIHKNIVTEPFNAERFFAEASENQNPTGPSRVYIEINVPAYRLELYEDGRLLKSFPIAIGMRKYKTPIRDFHIEQIEWNPWWYPPDEPWAKRRDEDGDLVPIKPKGPGPGNPLGPVKLVLQNAILLHGTNAPRSIGRMASHSCMRMYPDDASDLAWKVMVLAGTKQPLMKKELYRDGSKRTYKISLLTNVQVTTVYRRMEVRENFFLLHTDPYLFQPLEPEDVKARLNESGIPMDALAENRDSLFDLNSKKTLYVPIRL